MFISHWTCVFSPYVLCFAFLWVLFKYFVPSISPPPHIMASALIGGSPRKASFAKKAPSVLPLTLQLTPNVSATIGGVSLHNGFVSTLTSACQLDERSPTNAVAMYFMGSFCKQFPFDWVRRYFDAVPPGAYVAYLRPNATENTTRISFLIWPLVKRLKPRVPGLGMQQQTILTRSHNVTQT